MAYANGLDLTRTAVGDIPEFSPVQVTTGLKCVKVCPAGERADGVALDAAKDGRPVRVRIDSESHLYLATGVEVEGGEELVSAGLGKVTIKSTEVDATDIVIAIALEPGQAGSPVSAQMKNLN